MQDQAVSSITYNRTDVTPTTVTTEYRRSSDTTNANRQKIVQYMGLDSTAVAQVSTVTLALGTAADNYVVVIANGPDTKTYRHQQAAGDTANTLAEFLATIINTNPSVTATFADNVITLTSSVAGDDFVISNTGSTTVGNVVVATPTASAGTPKHRKRWEMFVNFNVTPQGFEQLTAQGFCYNGAEPPVQSVTFGPITLATSPTNLAQVQAVA